ncbi:spore coat U domain-containing protein [Luteimonas sp. XNQY3]|nr:spore coat U domain-containing protein [Luteimonas sp. XNQY3]MCD9005493.1 spore coat U domain-containing protein [Luteimonas sp. XNQY3]
MRLIPLTAATLLLTLAGTAHADITGEIDATITLQPGCIINGANTADGTTAVDFGALDFGAQTTVFAQADAEVQNTSSGIVIQCSQGITPVISFDGGLNAGAAPTGPGSRALALQGGTAPQYVTYNLYADAGRSTVIANDDALTLSADGQAQTVNVYGRAFGATGLVAGTYTDVIGVVITL